ncbi:hypothetical protein BX616_001898 [Lobosporangium transversale]|uniref:GDP-fucose protein O-fucosyltransferase 2 n=1 Tax=Lobosporangium transversale TaxID=64571 RepID=A0A1Y2GNU0_9FUNG|nr:GDP-fucose protein O-fucosyltransferase-domain-containing protein [Lobosporangium transversale]KAF9917122.1 hypothetical protein BX616_001898 [Lobosporangium transversale]ORZ16833.1 GDP-fucose protein O-fucosyltransferase-domain-containing protein [Lobosporangium transversale]|eukprot:XP_021881768.1 GDP-fucose protein O-fucosyltransferase-domain-containing protein [Lobosporangium transversale]
MTSSPKTSKYTLGLPAKYPSSGRRCHGQRRILFLFSLILLVSSGSMLILHITTTSPFNQATSDSLSCQVSSSSSSSSEGCPAVIRSRWRSDKESDNIYISQEEDSNPYMSHGRPRAALPRPVDNNIVDKQQEQQQQQNQFPSNETSNDSSQSPLSDVLNNGSTNTTEEDEEVENMAPAVPFEETFNKQDSTKYLTYLPYAGITNQFYGMLRGMEVARALDRTLILPPITASSHDKSKQNQPWSKFLDLKKFTEKTGIKVIEFHELRDVEIAELNQLQCGITCGFGSKRTIDFTAKGFLKQWKFNLTLSPLEQDVTRLEAVTSLLKPRSDEKYLCISNTYKIVVKDKSEWEHFGQHLYFTEELESHVRDFLSKNIVKPDPAIDPETKELVQSEEYRYLAIHVRRGDFAAYCEGNFQGPRMVHCLPSTEQIAERIDEVQKRLNPTMELSKILPVFVATNERRPEELKKFSDLGWRYLDHDQMGTAEKLGVFGPMMVDQVFMAHAQALVGIQMSTFSRVGALRQRDWHGREVEYM